MPSINANDYLVTSVRYNGTDENGEQIALRRISALDNVEELQDSNILLDNSYIVLADSINHKNYKKKLREITQGLKTYSKGYTDNKISILKHWVEFKLNGISNANIKQELININSRLDSLHTVAMSGDYNDLENAPNINEEINDIIGNIQETISSLPDIEQIGAILDEITNNSDNAILNSRIDELENKIKDLETYGPGGNSGGSETPDPNPPINPETPKPIYKFWIISDNELDIYFNGDSFDNEFNSKFVNSIKNSCPFTNAGYNALYWIKKKFEYDSNINRIEGSLYLVLPKKYSSISEEDSTVKINGRTLGSGVFAISGNSYYRQNVIIEDIEYNIIKIGNETSIGDSIRLTLTN